MSKTQSAAKGLLVAWMLLPAALMAQEIRYSWLDMSYMAQDVGRTGMQTVISGPDIQTVDINGSDGDGIRFRGSIGTWHNLYVFLNYGSTDIDVSSVVVSPLEPQGVLTTDEFDYTTIRGGVGLKYSIGFSTDIYGEVSYDSLGLDFGSLVGEDFDTDDQDIGGSLGVRTLINDDFELRAYGRYSNHADVDLNSLEFDTGTVFGAGFGWQLVRGFSIVGDYESGDLSSWSIGFRLDLDED